MARNTPATGVFRTKKAKPNCKPRPQNKTLGRMAARSLENRNGTPRMTTIPRSPVNRSIGARLSADHFENQRTLLRRRGRDAESVFHQLCGFFHTLFVGVVEPAQNSAGIHFLADLHFEDNADRGVDRVFLG